MQLYFKIDYLYRIKKETAARFDVIKLNNLISIQTLKGKCEKEQQQHSGVALRPFILCENGLFSITEKFVSLLMQNSNAVRYRIQNLRDGLHTQCFVNLLYLYGCTYRVLNADGFLHRNRSTISETRPAGVGTFVSVATTATRRIFRKA